MRKSVFLLALLLVGVMAACKTSDKNSGGGGTGGCGGGENACGAETDVAQLMIDQYLNGTQKASPWVALHETVSVGQMWHVESDFGAGKSTDKWQVVAKPGKSEFIIENLSAQGVVLAYQVDAWADAGKPNVKKAWIGKEGAEPKEIKVAEWKAGTGEAGEAPGIVVREDFANVEMGGKKFDGEVIIVKDSGNTTKTWIAKNGWFSKLIRMDMNDKTMMKVTKAHFDEKVDTFLKWPEAK
ncbi:MAG: hypothetical protein IPK87_09360 [Planctomycetes bacterium]|nr:hypothetical protein [Planctomycetota bacterium]